MDIYIAMKDHWKRYLVSSLITFAAGAAIVLYEQIDHITVASLKDGSLVGLLFVATRAGVKALLEVFIAWRVSFKTRK